MLEIYSVEQTSEDWFKARLGKPTASCFSQILAKGAGKTRRSYLLKLAAERVTGVVAETFQSDHMLRGLEQEPIVKELYELKTGNQVNPCGFMVESGIGYSPDGLVDEDGLIEIKTKLPHLQAEVLLDGQVPAEHLAQIQGGLLVSGRKWVDFISYSTDMPIFIKRVERDEVYIENLRLEIQKFEKDLQEAVEQLTKKF